MSDNPLKMIKRAVELCRPRNPQGQGRDRLR